MNYHLLYTLALSICCTKVLGWGRRKNRVAKIRVRKKRRKRGEGVDLICMSVSDSLSFVLLPTD